MHIRVHVELRGQPQASLFRHRPPCNILCCVFETGTLTDLDFTEYIGPANKSQESTFLLP